MTREEIEDIIDTRGWIYCNTCQRRIFPKEDLSEHDGHDLAVGQFSDDIASEESPAAD